MIISWLEHILCYSDGLSECKFIFFHRAEDECGMSFFQTKMSLVLPPLKQKTKKTKPVQYHFQNNGKQIWKHLMKYGTIYITTPFFCP